MIAFPLLWALLLLPTVDAVRQVKQQRGDDKPNFYVVSAGGWITIIE